MARPAPSTILRGGRGSTGVVSGGPMRGMPQLYIVNGGASPGRVGRYAVEGLDRHDARYLYRSEDALPLPAAPEPAARRSRWLTIRRLIGASAG